jgi:hypothetical protein
MNGVFIGLCRSKGGNKVLGFCILFLEKLDLLFESNDFRNEAVNAVREEDIPADEAEAVHEMGVACCADVYMVLEVFGVRNLWRSGAALQTVLGYMPVFHWSFQAKNIGNLSIVNMKLFLYGVIVGGRESCSFMYPLWLCAFLLLGGIVPSSTEGGMVTQLLKAGKRGFFAFPTYRKQMVSSMPLTRMTKKFGQQHAPLTIR